MEYATDKYAEVMYGEQPTQDSGEDTCIDLMRYLPPYWQKIKEMQALQDTLGYEVGNVQETLKDLVQQFFIESATWGLDRWEAIYGLAIDKSKSYIHRRERVKAKLRGAGSTTKQMVVNIASAFANGEAEVLEYPLESRFVVKFVGVKGVPVNMQDLTNIIEEIKPAHLAFTFEYTYNYWNELAKKTWKDLVPSTWNQAKVM